VCAVTVLRFLTRNMRAERKKKSATLAPVSGGGDGTGGWIEGR